jgi:large subunit ribosomal protein L13
MIQKTFMAKAEKVERKCYLIDAKDKVLGRVAAKAADILRGKHKAIYTPHVDTGDMVVIINAEQVKVTGKKLRDKIYDRYSGYHGGHKEIALQDLMERNPTTALKLAIRRMIPRGALGSKVQTKLRVYVGDQHPHQAQQPIKLEIK